VNGTSPEPAIRRFRGFATDISVDHGDQVDFKVKTLARVAAELGVDFDEARDRISAVFDVVRRAVTPPPLEALAPQPSEALLAAIAARPHAGG
jgi:hypothetical protein